MDRSPPGLAPRARVNRSASAPKDSTQSSGSMPLPCDLLILRPNSSRISPCRKTFRNGTCEPPLAVEGDRGVVGDERAEHHHPRHPEEQDVVAGDQDGGRIELRQFGGAVRPAHRRERPQRRGEPRVEHVGVLLPALRRGFVGADAAPSRRWGRARSGCGGPTTADARCTSRACCRPRRTSAAPGWAGESRCRRCEPRHRRPWPATRP